MRHVANSSSLDFFEKFVRTFVKNLGLSADFQRSRKLIFLTTQLAAS